MSSLELTSVTDLFDIVAIVVKQLEGGDYTCLIMSASPRFLESGLDSAVMVRPGVFRVRWTESVLRSNTKALTKLGYVVSIYRQEQLAKWYSRLERIPAYKSGSDWSELPVLASRLPTCHTYVELFGGGISMLPVIRPAPVEVHNDVDSNVTNFFLTLRQPKTFLQFFILSRLFLPTESFSSKDLLWYLWECKDEDVEADVVLWAYAWYCLIRQPYSLADFSRNVDGGEFWTEDAKPSTAALHAIDPLLPEIRDRLIRVQYEHNSWEKVLSLYDTDSTLFWVYPPPMYDLSQIECLINKLQEASGNAALCLRDDHHVAASIPLLEHIPWLAGWDLEIVGPYSLYVKRRK